MADTSHTQTTTEAAQQLTDHGAEAVDKSQAVTDYIWSHLADGYSWHLPFVDDIPLPTFFSLHAVMMLIAALFLIFVFCVYYRKHDPVPTGVTNLLEVFVIFIRDDISIPALGDHDGKRWTPLFCSFFFFILTLNLMGLIPLFVTATANAGVTTGLATLTLGFMIIGGLVKNGPLGLLQAFVPSGVPKLLLVLLVPLEMVGVLVKIFALTVRLFANLLAGHVVVYAVLGMVVMYGLIALPAALMALFITFIEILVAFLQAYIFTLLSALFIGQVWHPAH